MKDAYMVFVLIVVVMTPFLPLLWKNKCPACNKRKLVGVERTPAPEDEGRYLTYFACQNCQSEFTREKSGPLFRSDANSPSQSL